MLNSPVSDKIDRDIPNLKITKKRTNITKLFFSFALLLGIIIVGTGGVMFIHQLEERTAKRKVENINPQPVEEIKTEQNFESTKLRIKAEELNTVPDVVSYLTPHFPPPSGAINVIKTSNKFITPDIKSQSETVHPILSAQERRMSGDVLVNISTDKSYLSRANTNRRNNSIQNEIINTEFNHASFNLQNNGFDEKLKPSNLIAGYAAQRTDLRFLMRRGTSIQCGQITKIVTTHPSFVSCQVSKDVYSANGEVLLIERGSEVFGEQRSTMMQGQASIEVLWTRIDTPTGVVIDINSLATDSLGASGIPAEVDDHLMKRFGGAVMLSLIGDVGKALVNKSMSTSGPVQLTNTAGAGQDLASKTLDNTINIPPIAYSLQGSAITIFVARDMDFRTVYELAYY